MSQFGRLLQRASVVTDGLLSDCLVEIGNTANLSSSLRTPLAPASLLSAAGPKEAVFDDLSNLKYRGLFESPFVVGLEREGYEPTVSMEVPVPLKNTQNIPILRRGDRLQITPDEDERTAVQLVWGVKSVQPDSQWRVLIELHLLGPLCQSAKQYKALPYTLPIVLGGITFDQCVHLDDGPSFVDRLTETVQPVALPYALPIKLGDTKTVPAAAKPYTFIE